MIFFYQKELLERPISITMIAEDVFLFIENKNRLFPQP